MMGYFPNIYDDFYALKVECLLTLAIWSYGHRDTYLEMTRLC